MIQEWVTRCIHLETIAGKLERRSVSGCEDDGIKINFTLVCKHGSIRRKTCKGREGTYFAGFHRLNEFISHDDTVSQLSVSLKMGPEPNRTVILSHFYEQWVDQLEESIVLENCPEYSEHSYGGDRL